MSWSYRAFFVVPLLLLALLSFPAAALEEEPFADPELEARAQALFSELRCVVCQHESIASSQAELARDMRRFVRARLSEGESPEAIKQALAARFGDFVLFDPPFKSTTWVLWALPFAFMGLGLLFFARLLRRSTKDKALRGLQDE